MSNNNFSSLAALKAGNPNTNTTLSDDKVVTLLTRSKNGDIKARNELLMLNMGLIVSMAKKVESSIKSSSNFKADRDDLVNNGCIRFLEIINGFNPEKGKLSTYIWHPVLNAMYEGIDGYKKELGSFLHSYKAAVEFLFSKYGREPVEQEIADFMGISMRIFKNRMEDLKNRSSISFDAPISDENSDSATLLDSVFGASKGDASSAVITADECNCIRLSWNRLSNSERKDIMFRIRDNGEKISLRDAEKISKVSKETIRTRENVAKQHFQEILEEYGVMAA